MRMTLPTDFSNSEISKRPFGVPVKMTMGSTTTTLDLMVDEDSLSQILLYTDVQSAICFSQCSRRILNDDDSSLQHVWNEFFQRQLFSPEDLSQQDDDDVNYRHEINYRRQLFHNLVQFNKKASCSFSLPHRYFHFWPLLPPADDDFNRNDPPPVLLDCDSFLLTSTATSEEFVLLDPFTGTLAVYPSILQQCQPRELALLPRHEVSVLNNNNNNNNTTNSSSSPQVLLTIEDYFHINMGEYFQRTAENNSDEYEVSYLGIETKPILLQENNKTQGTMIAVGRMLSDNEDTWNDQNRIIELLAWFKTNNNEYTDRHVCRFRGAFQSVDISASHKRLYMNQLDDNAEYGKSTIEVYRLEPYPPNQQETTTTTTTPTHFPAEPEFVVNCRQQVSTLSVCASGTQMVVATAQGQVQMWHIPNNPTSVTLLLEQTIPIHTVLQKAFQGRGMNFHPDPVHFIVTPRHLPMNASGFVTCQDSRTHGTCLLLWKKQDNVWSIHALIKVPLSSRRAPQVHYDGRRLIVLGQDHIGIIILIYQILTPDDTPQQEESLVERSGGVYNLNSSVRFVNRIRHAALGGFEYYDNLYMTCNERFIVVNTKTGNLLNETESTYCTEGLVVIDLEEEEETRYMI